MTNGPLNRKNKVISMMIVYLCVSPLRNQGVNKGIVHHFVKISKGIVRIHSDLLRIH
jgi:hypothetical protein